MATVVIRRAFVINIIPNMFQKQIGHVQLLLYVCAQHSVSVTYV